MALSGEGGEEINGAHISGSKWMSERAVSALL